MVGVFNVCYIAEQPLRYTSPRERLVFSSAGSAGVGATASEFPLRGKSSKDKGLVVVPFLYQYFQVFRGLMTTRVRIPYFIVIPHMICNTIAQGLEGKQLWWGYQKCTLGNCNGGSFSIFWREILYTFSLYQSKLSCKIKGSDK